MKKSIKKLEYLYLNPNSVGIERYIKTFKNYHSRWIHTSWLLLEDLNKEVTFDGIEYTIFGMLDNEDSEVVIMLKPKTRGAFRLVNSKKVAKALGYKRMRNLATGEERTKGVEDVVTMNKAVPLVAIEETDSAQTDDDYTDNEILDETVYDNLDDYTSDEYSDEY